MLTEVTSLTEDRPQAPEAREVRRFPGLASPATVSGGPSRRPQCGRHTRRLPQGTGRGRDAGPSREAGGSSGGPAPTGLAELWGRTAVPHVSTGISSFPSTRGPRSLPRCPPRPHGHCPTASLLRLFPILELLLRAGDQMEVWARLARHPAGSEVPGRCRDVSI